MLELDGSAVEDIVFVGGIATDSRFEGAEVMLTTNTFEKALDLIDSGYTFSSVTEKTGITLEDAEAVHVAWFNGTSEQVHRELRLASVLEIAATRLRSGQGWNESTTADVLNEVLHVFPGQVKKALAMALLAGKL